MVRYPQFLNQNEGNANCRAAGGAFPVRGDLSTTESTEATELMMKEKTKKLKGVAFVFSLYYPLPFSVFSVSSVVKSFFAPHLE
jgi:hypothetical protein